MKVGFGCDHTAIDLKKELMEYMTEKGYECVDYGAYDAKVRVDYPDQGQKFLWRQIKCRESARQYAASRIQLR